MFFLSFLIFSGVLGSNILEITRASSLLIQNSLTPLRTSTQKQIFDIGVNNASTLKQFQLLMPQ